MNGGTVDAMKSGMDELQKALYTAGEKLYKAQAPQGDVQGNPQGYPGAGPQSGADNVYDADYKDVD